MKQILFPINRVPPEVRAVILSIEGKTQAPTALVASSIFSAISLATQSAFDVQRSDGLISPVAMYFLVIAVSGERKTSVDNIAMQPFHDFQKQLKSDERFIFSDITPFAFLSKLHSSSRSAALFENEAGRFFDSKLIDDLGLLNKLWDGKSLSVHRHKTSIEIDEPRCTMSLMIQPKIFRSAMRRTGGRLSDYGFLARCLICEPPTKLGFRPIIKSPIVNSDAYENFCEKIKNLLAEQTEFFLPGSEMLQRPRKVIKLDPYAQDAWISTYNYIEHNSGSHGIYRDHTEYASKMAENIARLAGVLHIFEHPESDIISEATLLSAADIIFWYANEYMRLFSDDGSHDQIVEDARKLENFLIKTFNEKNIQSHRKTDLLHYGPNSLRKAGRLDTAIYHLIQQGKIVVFQQQKHNAAQRISTTAWIALSSFTQPVSYGPHTAIYPSLVCTNTFNSISAI